MTTRLTLVATITMAAVVIALPMLMTSFKGFREARANNQLLDQINGNRAERELLRGQFLLYRESRALDSWRSKRAATDVLMEQAKRQFRDKQDLQELAILHSRLDEVGALFLRIVDRQDRPSGSEGLVSDFGELEKRLLSQVLLKATAAREAAKVLQNRNSNRMDAAYERLSIMVIGFTVVLGTVTIFGALQIGRSIRTRVVRLEAGVRDIAAGKLDHRLQVEGQDEFSELSRSINAMAMDLDTSTRRLGEEMGRRLAMESVKASDERYRVLVENLTSGVVVHGPDTAIQFSNPMAATLLGLTEDQMQGKTALDPRWRFVREDGSPLPLEEFPVNRVIGSGQAFQAQVLGVQRPDLDQPVWLHCNAFPVRDDAAALVQVVVTFNDITERKRALEALDQEHELKELYLRVAQVILVAFDAQARVTLLNRKGYEVLGYEEGELVGQDWFRVCLPAEEYEAVLSVYQRALAGDLEPVEYYENHIVRKDGTRRLIAWHNTALRNAEGRIIGTLSSGEDITDRAKAEEERTRLQAQLNQAQRMDSLGSLAGGVAHDMNNVLGAILGLASAHLELQPPASPTHRAFETITKAAQRGRDLVKGLLDFARHGLEGEANLDLNTLLEEEVRILERTTLSKVHLLRELAPDLRPIRGDASALTHALMNLCVNAVEAMPEAGTLILRTRNVDDWVEVQVEDTGTGMDPAVLRQAMDPYFTTKEVGKGTGLGLSLVYSAVKAHKGLMEIRSEPGRGTCVYLRFPACAAADSPLTQVPTAGVQASPKGLEVLLVDDDELVRSSTEILLDVLGHTVRPACSGEEALGFLEAGYRPDRVILDMNMPGLGGMGALPRLRSLCPEVPVLLATGRVDQAALTLAEGDVWTRILPKPFSADELKSSLESCGPA